MPEEESVSVDLILQNLTRRPNVRSTLILSRKNGSIIKTSGSIADESLDEREPSNQHNVTEGSTSFVQNSTESTKPASDASDLPVEEPKMSRAQVLAASIYAFVAAAVDLGSSLQSVENRDSSVSRTQDIAKSASQNVGSHGYLKTEAYAEDDVQLLRLRLKRQEIIIFPDPNYLCCVVQDLDKNAR